MCKEEIVYESGAARSEDLSATGRCVGLGKGVWAVGVSLGSAHPARNERPPTRFHFVLDNSGSMGRNTHHAKECFAELVALANAPCSLVAFESKAVSLGESFRTVDQMRAAPLPRQGGTNITAGLENAVEIIQRCEREHEGKERTHHILVLLSDGQHTVGTRPEQRLPGLGVELHAALPELRLSVVVVGVTGNSNTSMGMLLKQTLETVALPSLEPIYFANTPALMDEALRNMHEGFATLRGSLVNVAAPGGCRFVRAVGEEGVSSLDVLAEAHERALLCLGEAPPGELLVDGVLVPCAPPSPDAADFDTELAASALQGLVDAVRVRRVAIGAEGVRPALQQLRSWAASLEERAAKQRAACGAATLHLAKATPGARLAQHKAMKRATLGARELLNQLADIDAHSANDSASQAAFLTGAGSKFAGKALRRAAAHSSAVGHEAGPIDAELRFKELVADLRRLGPKMRAALREDFCGKLASLPEVALARLRERLMATLPGSVSRSAIGALCSGSVAVASLADDKELAELLDSGLAVEHLLAVTGGMRQSFVSLQTAWEQLKEWRDLSPELLASCRTEYHLLMCLGTLGYPIDVQRRAATQMDPFAMDVTRIRASLADTASMSAALQSEQAVYPPEGGTAIEDLLVLVDPDVPRASRLAASSMLLREAYSSVVLCRDLHMYTGSKMRLALHAHAFLSAVRDVREAPAEAVSRKDLEAQLRRQYLGRAYQCAQCSFGPIDHFACGDLEAHHGEDVGGAVINNACPRCKWFSESLRDWPKWDGTVPPEAGEAAAVREGQGAAACMITAASAEIALRICYSARAIWKIGQDDEAETLCAKLANWETLTTADGVDHPVQLLLALAVLDEVPEEALGQVPTSALLNEVCARCARDELRKAAGTDEGEVAAAARRRVSAFLGVTAASSPTAAPLEESEPQRDAVREACCADYTLDPGAFDFKAWVKDVLTPWTPALIFVLRLRAALSTRQGGWLQLERDMEASPEAYADVVKALQKSPGSRENLRTFLGVERACDAPHVLATVAAQAFMHNSSQLRRTVAAGGTLKEPLGDVRDTTTLRMLCVDLRMMTYEERVAAKMREWGRLGASLTCQRARAADLDQYASMCGRHVHGLDGPTFWGLWRAAKGEKAKEFLRSANQGFNSKYGSR